MDYLSDFAVVASVFDLQQDFVPVDFSPEQALASVFSPEEAFASVFSPEQAFAFASFLQHAFSSFFFLSSPFLSSPFTDMILSLEEVTNEVADVAPTIPVNAYNKNNFFMLFGFMCLLFVQSLLRNKGTKKYPQLKKIALNFVNLLKSRNDGFWTGDFLLQTNLNFYSSWQK